MSACHECEYHYSGACYRLASGPRDLVALTECPKDNWLDEYGGHVYKSEFPHCTEICDGCLYDGYHPVRHCDECFHGIVRPRDISAGPCPFKLLQRGKNDPSKKLRCHSTEPRVSEDLAPIILKAVNNNDDTYFQYWIDDKVFAEPGDCGQKIANFLLRKGKYYHSNVNAPMFIRIRVNGPKDRVYTIMEMPVNHAELDDEGYSEPVLKLQYITSEGQRDPPTFYIHVGDAPMDKKGRIEAEEAEEEVCNTRCYTAPEAASLDRWC